MYHGWMAFEHDYSTQSQPQKLRLLAAYHAELATAINRDRPGWNHEAAFHWEAAVDMLGLANRLDFERER